jgi:hypothetical protein
MNIFAQLAKYDENTGYFEAIAADESLDHANEIFDYAKSKPHFEAWSSGISKSTGGKSVGNIRAMHGKVAAGKLSDIVFDDDAKAIKIAGLVIDPVEKTKMASGVYTGVSIGGSYGETWDDPVIKGAKRYEAIPTEISIVDLPCNGNAFFTVVKSDGAEELRKFETTTDNVEALAKWVDGLSDAERETLAKVAARHEVTPKDDEESTTGDLSKSATSPEEDAMNDELQKSLTTAQADLAKAADDLAKVSGERDDLKKALDTAATELAARDELLMKAATALDERNAVIEKFKNAPAPVKAALLAISKGEDIGTDLPEVDKVKKADGTVDEAATEIKKALMNPVFTR